MKTILFLTLFIPFIAECQPPASSFKIGKLKYNGGGDWYANPTSLPNLFKFIKQNTRANLHLEEEIVEPASAQVFQYNMLYITGHGNIELSPSEVENLRKYLKGGGFLLIDDNYGMQQYAKREIKKLFPDNELVEIPFNHPIYNIHYKFPKGMPKIHEHDGKPPQALGIFIENRLALILTFETDLGDGWEDQLVHNDPEAIRQIALQMGANILLYVISK